MKRREFLQHSSVYTLAGLTLPLPAFSRNLSANPVRVAVVGSGGRGTDLIRKMGTIEQAKIVAVCDNYEPHLDGGLMAAGAEASPFSDYQKMLTTIQPDAVVIATPLYLHYEMAVAAVEAGCAVFCEKTMCYSPEQATKLASLVKARNAIFQVGLQRHANAIYRQAMSMIEQGMLGRITAIKSQWHRNNDWRRPVPVPKEHPDWNRLERHINWRLFNEYSRGLLTELGSHQMDVANWAMGQIPSRVMATGGIDFWRDGREVYDNVFCIFEYDVKPQEGDPYVVRATYSSLQNNAYEGASELILGTKGSLYLTSGKGMYYREKGVDLPDWKPAEQADQNAEVITSGKTLQLSNNPWAHRGKPYEMDPAGNDTRDQLVSFLDHVQRKDPNTICNAHTGMEDALTVLTAHQAIEAGKMMEIASL